MIYLYCTLVAGKHTVYQYVSEWESKTFYGLLFLMNTTFWFTFWLINMLVPVNIDWVCTCKESFTPYVSKHTIFLPVWAFIISKTVYSCIASVDWLSLGNAALCVSFLCRWIGGSLRGRHTRPSGFGCDVNVSALSSCMFIRIRPR